MTQVKLLCLEQRFVEAFAALQNLASKHFHAGDFRSVPLPPSLVSPTLSDVPLSLNASSSLLPPTSTSSSKSSASSIQPVRPVFAPSSSSSASPSSPSVEDASLNSARVEILLQLAEACALLAVADSSSVSDAQLLIGDALQCLQKAKHLAPAESRLSARVHTAIAQVLLSSSPSSSSSSASSASSLSESESDVAALAHLEAALAIDGSLVDAHVSLGSLHAARGRDSLAHTHLAAAIRVDATCSEAWLHLGRLLRADQGQQHHQHHHTHHHHQQHNCDKLNEAQEALLTALELERTAPVRCFSVIPRTLSF